jgi:CRP-like cAMP-binding protein
MVEKYTITKKDEVFSLLKDKRNFEYMNEVLLRRLINEMKVIRFTEKTLLIKQDSENHFIYIIIRGGVTVYVDKKPLYMLRRTGDVFGELSFVTKAPSTASIVAEKDLGVMAISFSFLKKLNSMEFGLWLCRVIGDKLIRTSKLKTAEALPTTREKTTVNTKQAPFPLSTKPVAMPALAPTETAPVPVSNGLSAPGDELTAASPTDFSDSAETL